MDAELCEVELQSCRTALVSSCSARLRGVRGLVVTLRRQNGLRDIAPVHVVAQSDALLLLREEPERAPSIRRAECASESDFAEQVLRESRRMRCCTRMFTGVRQQNKQIWGEKNL